MELALVLSAALMGLAGGAHCLAMCSAACAAAARACGGAPPQRALLALLAGRLVSYALAGALVAASVAVLARWGSAVPWLRPLWSMLHLAALALGLWLLWAGRAPAWMAAWTAPWGRWGGAIAPREAVVSGPLPYGAAALAGPARIAMPVAARPRAGLWRAGLVGTLWVGLPCGLLQSALLVAALASTPWSGAFVMIAFALTSSLGLWLGPTLWQWLGGRGDAARWQRMAVRFAGAMLASASAWALVMGWTSLAQPALCL